MRRLVVAAATAATLGTLGLTATAQAQPSSTAATVTKTVVAGIPSGFTVKAPSSSKACTWAVTGTPTAKTDLKNYGFLVSPLCGATG